MFLNIVICDDDTDIQEQIKSFIENYEMAFDHDFRIDLFSDGSSLIESDNLSKYNILFLDIEMPVLSGIDTARIILDKIDPFAKIIFFSNYPEYMQSSFSVHPFHYLQKPLSKEMIFSVLTSAIRTMERQKTIITFTLPDLSIRALYKNDIVYIESDNSRKRTVTVHSIDSVFNAKGVMAEFGHELNTEQFIRCHKSILVNLFHIHYLQKQEIILDNDEKIPVGRTYYSELRKKLSHIVFRPERDDTPWKS